jgi:hypothetical protein
MYGGIASSRRDGAPAPGFWCEPLIEGRLRGAAEGWWLDLVRQGITQVTRQLSRVDGDGPSAEMDAHLSVYLDQ